MGRGVLAGYLQRGGTDVDGRHAAIGDLPRQADRDDPAAGPHVADGRAAGDALRQVDRRNHQVLGFGPRDEHVGRNAKGKREEFAPAHEIGHRRAFGPPPDQVAQRGPRRVVRLFVESGVEVDPLAVERFGQKHLRVEARRLGTVPFQIVGGPGEEAADVPDFAMHHRIGIP